jgi:rod shape-determining protein MreC
MKKINLLILMLFAAALLFVFTIKTSQTQLIQSFILNLLSPFIRTSANFQERVSHDNQALSPQELLRENHQLRLEIDRLNLISQKLPHLNEENQRLNQLLKFKQEAPYKLIATKVIKRASHTWWHSLIIDKGSLDGLAISAPVITQSGLVGKIGKLTDHMAEVILLTDEMCKVAAKVQGSFDRGIVIGERVALDDRPELKLRFLNRNSNLLPGTEVFSSGEGGVFPPDIRIGVVKNFLTRDISGEAILEPSVDFNTLTHVFVIELIKKEAAP